MDVQPAGGRYVVVGQGEVAVERRRQEDIALQSAAVRGVDLSLRQLLASLCSAIVGELVQRVRRGRPRALLQYRTETALGLDAPPFRSAVPAPVTNRPPPPHPRTRGSRLEPKWLRTLWLWL